MSTCKACHTIPPVIVDNYSPSGNWTRLGGLDVYVTGSTSARNAIICFYDAFGASQQILQGADLVAITLNAIILVPDFFRGNPAQYEWFTNQSQECKQAKETWLKNMKFKEHLPDLYKVLDAAKDVYPEALNWGAYGLCWGGKMAVLASGEGTPFKVSGQVHPGKLAAEDARSLKIPHIMLASRDEDATVVEEYAKLLASEGKIGEVETYASMHHGWMGARANLKEDNELKEYNQLAEFFAKHL
ncbi:AIM2 family protein C30D10.14 [Phlyctema vagabunda]|uniref:AIM2 family protein C30D10.14 n=1 Tax=Phlyctema vagabunda TaxID=108571 RepID=A0ABR4P814_9HELO